MNGTLVKAKPPLVVYPPLDPDQAKAGWTAETWYQRLRTTDPYQYRSLVLLDWKRREHVAHEAIKQFKLEHNLTDADEKEELARLEAELAEITVQVDLANEAAAEEGLEV